MDESTRLRMRRAHANHAFYCTCGKVVHGNGGRASHAYMHERRGDSHYYTTADRYRALYPPVEGVDFEYRNGVPYKLR